MTIVCERCGRTLDATESKYSTKVIKYVGAAAVTWCCDCLEKSPAFSNER